ncbi:MAG: hypothetical protein KKC76_00050 [Proteobacteria bacterium]|nr:hypothetical protein [Pseudomonadota bacterium]MBU4297586.1 hypothetical protein [Pseudomonadota bacterium]MCG2748852.1 hypothetical protein [Desulfobulbaceae bacterium]
MQHRQLNEPAEIRRRLFFILYLACWIAAILLFVIGIARGHLFYIAYALVLGGGCLMFKKMGEHSLQFKRLARSFPYGDAHDLPAPLRTQVENIFRAFHENQDWQQRLELRRKLTSLVKEKPELMEIYPKEISAINPKLTSYIRPV